MAYKCPQMNTMKVLVHKFLSSLRFAAQLVQWKARLEAMATLKMSGCVPPLAMQDKA